MIIDILEWFRKKENPFFWSGFWLMVVNAVLNCYFCYPYVAVLWLSFVLMGLGAIGGWRRIISRDRH